ncbi:MAG: SH3 domain-containing protein [Lachnospiraceae bacterium]|nr:SH3 domain-containing protein [Lachnospiraceae bacterium]
MKKKGRVWMISLALAAAMAVSITGCGKELTKETETEPQTEKITEPVTEKVTEPPTEKQTETETETEEKELTPEEEKNSETELKGNKTLYAKDDINVRTEPSTDADIISSYDQGEEVTVSAETKNWYKIQKDGYSGYVYKDGLSETAVEPKSAEERQQIMEQQGNASSSSATDLEYDVRSYAESFPLILSADANVRSVPSEEGNILNTISSGTSVTALGETDRWYKIEYDGITGYVNKNLVQ